MNMPKASFCQNPVRRQAANAFRNVVIPVPQTSLRAIHESVYPEGKARQFLSIPDLDFYGCLSYHYKRCGRLAQLVRAQS